MINQSEFFEGLWDEITRNTGISCFFVISVIFIFFSFFLILTYLFGYPQYWEYVDYEYDRLVSFIKIRYFKSKEVYIELKREIPLAVFIWKKEMKESWDYYKKYIRSKWRSFLEYLQEKNKIIQEKLGRFYENHSAEFEIQYAGVTKVIQIPRFLFDLIKAFMDWWF